MIAGPTQSSVQQYTDADIIEKVLSGQPALFEIIIRRYNPVLYKTGRSYGFNHQDTEDLMQETFINAYVHLVQFAGRASFKTWLIKIMLHQCYHKANSQNHRRQQAAEHPPNNATFMFQHQQSNDGNAVINNELKKVVEASLQTLPLDYRTTFALRELAGLSVAETAAAMQTTPANVKVRLNRAKAMLRREIEKIYTPEDIYEFNLVYCDRIVEAVMLKINDLNNAGRVL